ncbi:hypothetical protein [Oscillatoria sp. HE19RPO]|uniref:hypothetical protein n=1 Tax=Oscillatoria sp. HE19RPO TaxID=2954806 RepID=UPI0020C38984|nr:hypothetical protein [Oscillatoria sp. HE19RPO]
MVLTPGPLPGYYIEAETGIALDKTAQNPTPEGNERCFIKDCIAAWLGLTIANPRIGTFGKSEPANPAQTNEKRMFALRGQRGSYQYKILLIPGTGIPVKYYKTGVAGVTNQVIQRNSFSISLSRTIGVAELRSWLISGTGANGKGAIKPEITEQIMGLVTPWDRKYIWRTPLISEPAFPELNTDVHTVAQMGAAAPAP